MSEASISEEARAAAALASARQPPEAGGGLAARARWRALALCRDIAARLGLLDGLQSARARLVGVRSARATRAIVGEILARLPDSGFDGEDPHAWRFQGTLPTESDLTIAIVGPAAVPYRALIKLAGTQETSEGLAAHRIALERLREDPRLGELRELLPTVLEAGERAGTPYLLERRVPGILASQLLRRGGDHAQLIAELARAISLVHRATAHEAQIDGEALERWISRPERAVADLIERLAPRGSALPTLAELCSELRARLEGETLLLAQGHGDYAPGNLIVDESGRLRGILDWEVAHPSDLPLLDIVTLLLTNRMSSRRAELGAVMSELLTDPSWSAPEAELLAEASRGLTGTLTDTRTLLLIFWLRHVASQLNRCRRYRANGLWVHSNVTPVLDTVARRNGATAR